MATQANEIMETRGDVLNEAHEHARTHPVQDVEIIQTGPSTGPDERQITRFDDITVVSTRVRFPMMVRGATPKDRITITRIKSAPPGSLRSGIGIESGTVLLHGPGTPHTAVSPVGSHTSFCFIGVQALEETADRLGMPMDLPPRGHMRRLASTPLVHHLTTILGLESDLGEPHDIAVPHQADALHAAAAALSMEQPRDIAGVGARIDSRHIVNVCVEYADAMGRTPTISEMCLVAHLSERRLRDAFVEEFRMSPMGYFRYRSLSQARATFMDGVASHDTVAAVAYDLGFSNLGRFAHRYAGVFDELPSETLRSNR